jgi:hypothetical protein
MSPRLTVIVRRKANALAILDRGLGNTIEMIDENEVTNQSIINNQENSKNLFPTILRKLLVRSLSVFCIDSLFRIY